MAPESVTPFPNSAGLSAHKESVCGYGASALRSGRERSLDLAPCAARLGKARTYEIKRHHHEASTEHEPARAYHIEVEIERTLQHPQRRDVGLDAERNRLGDESQRSNHTGQRKQHRRWQLAAGLAPPDEQPITDQPAKQSTFLSGAWAAFRAILRARGRRCATTRMPEVIRPN
jgi:hypothetical protein